VIWAFTAEHLPKTVAAQEVATFSSDIDMKEIFKSTALNANRCAGPLQDFYARLLAKGMKPDMARLTLARNIAAITLALWKKGGGFDAEHLKSQAA
jgi:hypothetical protein